VVDTAVRIRDAWLLVEEIGRLIDELIEDDFPLSSISPRVRRPREAPASPCWISTFALGNKIGATASASQDKINVSGAASRNDREFNTIKHPGCSLSRTQLVRPPEYSVVEAVSVRVENLAKARRNTIGFVMLIFHVPPTR